MGGFRRLAAFVRRAGAIEADGERWDRLAFLLRTEAENDGRIESAAEIAAERYFAAQPATNGSAQHLFQLRRRLVVVLEIAFRAAVGKIEIPVASSASRPSWTRRKWPGGSDCTPSKTVRRVGMQKKLKK